ncbi:DUF4403 family protein [Fibrella sp. HMF5335]|uniref:DUF4403 family protein n=1 Tax=Fibrella rubiginis TaxID=2817060 RepID=A0A939GGA1_9BACT|nr:DUF4403 family protein [Fibrella rubiginis]
MPKNRNSATVPPRLRLNKRGVAAGTAYCYCLLLFALTACSPNSGRLNPTAPTANYKATNMDVHNESLLSTVNIPVSIALADVERQINTQVNGLIYEDNSFDNDGDGTPFMTNVWKRAPIRVSAGVVKGDSLFYFQVPLKIWAKAGKKVLGFMQSGETTFEIDLKFATRFSIDPDWSVSTQTRAEGYDFVTTPTVRLVGFDIPITGLVRKAIDNNLGTITAALDKQVKANIDLKTPVLRTWNLVREPYNVSEEFRTWLSVVPRRVLITPLRFEQGEIRTTIGLEGHTLTTIGPKPPVRPAAALPDLTVVPTVKDDFRVGIIAEATYPEVAELAKKQLVGKSFSFRDGAYNVTVTDIDLYGQNDNLIVKAGITGSVTGDIYLRGQPYYDPQTKTVALRNLTYDLDTKNLLQRAASWLLQSTLAKTMEKNMAFPVGDQIDAIRQSVQERLTNYPLAKGVTLKGKITDVRPDQVYLTPTAMVAVVYANGKVDVKVAGL